MGEVCGMWRWSWASWGGGLFVRHPQWFMGRLLDGICFATSRIHLPLMLSFELLWYTVEKENKRLK